ncbi:hypothetical protein PFISCL1PPCAC_2742, partial [Pristionchus fissidentatus]
QVLVSGNVFCSSAGKRVIPRATVNVVHSVNGRSQFINGTTTGTKGEFNFVATVDQNYSGQATQFASDLLGVFR